MELHELLEMTKTLHREQKEQLVHALLSDLTNANNYGEPHSKVALVKLFKEFSGLGLLSSKVITEAMLLQEAPEMVHYVLVKAVNDANFKNQFKTLVEMSR